VYQIDVIHLLITLKRYSAIDAIFRIKDFVASFLRKDRSLFDFFTDIDAFAPGLVMPILQQLLACIRTPMDDVENYRQIILVVKHQIYSQFGTWLHLFQCGFLDVCILQPPESTRRALFQSEEWLNELIVQVCSVDDARTVLPNCILAILEISEVPGYADYFLKIFPFPHVIRALLSRADKKAFSVLLVDFSANPKIAEEFVSGNGVSALPSALAQVGITIDFYADFIANLVCCRRFEEVDQFITNLPCDHSIYQLSQTLMVEPNRMPADKPLTNVFFGQRRSKTITDSPSKRKIYVLPIEESFEKSGNTLCP
jgi:hypothetical protein